MRWNPFRRPDPEKRSISTVDEWIEALNEFQFNGLWYGGLNQTLTSSDTERATNDFVGLASQAYAANGVVFAVMLARQLVFSSVRFRWQRLSDGKPSDSFGSKELGLFETPWIGGTTQDMLTRMIQDADLAGNSYWTRDGNEMVRLRPDWVDIIAEPRFLRTRSGQVGWKKVGYLYTEGGPNSGNEPAAFEVNEVAHFAPNIDPLARFRGMSWLTPILREIQADQSMTRHQRKFFDNGATVNMVIKHNVAADENKVRRWIDQMRERHAGVDNAYKTLHLYPGADAVPVGANLKDIDFKAVRGGGETRVAAAGGVPPIIVGLSEGLASATYSNYGQARRRFADGTMHPLWQNVSGSMGLLLPSQGTGTRLWYDASDVPFLREDEKDAAEIAFVQAQTIRQLIEAGYEPQSVIRAVEANDWRLLVHTGYVSVQLQKPGSETQNGAIQANSTKQLAWKK